MQSELVHPRVSVREIAEHLGLSRATISMALKDNTRISEKTRQKVQRYAASIGYRPDPMLAVLAHHRDCRAGKTVKAGIAWINAWPVPERLRSYREFDGYWRGAKAEAEKFGYRMEEFRVGHECSPARLHKILSTRGIRGILLPPSADQPDWGDFPWEDYVVVRFGRSLQFPMTHVVASDQVVNAMLAFTSLRNRGYRKIGFVTQLSDPKRGSQMFGAGFLGAQTMVAKEERIPVFKYPKCPAQACATGFRRWFDEYRPDAILTDRCEIFDLLKQADLKVPRDLGLAVASVLDGGADTGIDQHAEEIGREGFLMLNSLLKDGEKGKPKILRQLLVKGDWVDGGSSPWKNA